MSKNDTNGSTVAPAAKPASKEDLKKLFGQYDAAAKKIDDAKAALEKAVMARSAIVQAITEAAGGKKGPFRHPTSGLVLSAVERVNKTTGESNWFFKGPAQSDVIEV